MIISLGMYIIIQFQEFLNLFEFWWTPQNDSNKWIMLFSFIILFCVYN